MSALQQQKGPATDQAPEVAPAPEQAPEADGGNQAAQEALPASAPASPTPVLDEAGTLELGEEEPLAYGLEGGGGGGGQAAAAPPAGGGGGGGGGAGGGNLAVVVNVNMPKFRVDHSKTKAEIGAISESGGNNAGLARATRTKNLKFNQSWQERAANGRSAYYLKDVTIDIGYKDAVVYVAKEFPASSREYQVTHDHEHEHVALFEEIIGKAASTLRNQKPAKMWTRIPTASSPFVGMRDHDTALRAAQSFLKSAVTAVFDKWLELLEKGHGHLDSDYASVYAQADNWDRTDGLGEAPAQGGGAEAP